MCIRDSDTSATSFVAALFATSSSPSRFAARCAVQCLHALLHFGGDGCCSPLPIARSGPWPVHPSLRRQVEQILERGESKDRSRFPHSPHAVPGDLAVVGAQVFLSLIHIS